MTAAVPTGHVLAVAVILVAIGTLGVLLRRNLLFVLLSLEVVLNGAALAFVGAGARWQQPDGQVMAVLIMVVAAAEVAVALALLLRIHHHAATLDSDSLAGLRG